jgi:gamma-glutamylcyclotransferase (GGCT)/AIG2-like uncharacterized protein YtfP
VIASRYNASYLLNIPVQGNSVVGEIYSVVKDKLRHLDVLEDYTNYYTRSEVTITIQPSKSYYISSGPVNHVVLPQRDTTLLHKTIVSR